MVSRTTALVVLVAVAVLAADYHFMYRAPSLELIAYINRVTGNDLFFDKPIHAPAKPQLQSAVSLPPGVEKTNAIADEVSVVGSTTNRRFQAAEAKSKKSEKAAASETTAVVAVADAPVETLPDFRTRRFGAKLHMIFQGQFFLDYPISYFLTVDVGMADWWWMSANLISMIHPFVGLLAGYVIVKSSFTTEKEGKLEKKQKSLKLAPAPQSPQGASTSAGFEHVALMPVASPVAPTTVHCAPITPPATSVVTLNTSASPTVPIKPTPSGAAIVEFDNVDSDAADNNELAEKSASSRRLFSSVNMKLLRIGALLFWLRNYLDTFDGVMARVQRHRAGVRYTSTTMGFNGHSLDVLNDALGGTCVMLGVFFMLCTKNLPIARIPSAILVRLGFRHHLSKSQVFSKVVAFVGLLNLLLTGTCWETFMLRYSNLFDQHANTNPAIFELDSHPQVRFNQWMWSMICGDSLMQYVLVAMLFSPQKVWDLAQTYFFVGIPGVLAIFAYSFWVWDNVILQNPIAARIIAENPGQFI